MATYTKRTTTTTRHEFEVPTGPYGADTAEIGKALTAAEREFRQLHEIPEEVALAADALRWFPLDESIVIAFTVEVPEEPTA